MVALVNSFGTSAESTALYTGTTTARVTEIYRNVLNRDPDVGGLLYWSTEIDSGRLSLARVALAVIEAGARDPADGLVVTAKTNVAVSYTAAVNTVAEINAYNGNAAAASARTLLRTVVATTTTANFQASVDTNIANLVANNGGAAIGSTLTLTTGADTLTGTTSNDTFVGTFSADAGVTTNTFTASDNINGAAGVDSLSVTTSGTAAVVLPAGLVSNVEGINVRAVLNAVATDTSLVASNFLGATAFISDRSTSQLTVTALGTGATTGINGDGTVTSGNLSFKYATETDAVTLLFTNGAKVSGAAPTTVTNTGTGATAATINSTGAANSTGIITLAATATVAAVTINAATNLTIGTGATAAATDATVGIATGALVGATITVTGAGLVDLNTLGAAVKAVTATGNTGGVTIDGGFDATDAFTGGAGNDTVTLAVGLTTGSAAAGAGTGDRLVTTDAVAVSTAAFAAKVSGFEILREQDTTAGVYDLSLLTGVTSIEVNGTGGATFNNLALSGTTTVIGATVGNLTLGLLTVTPGGNDAYTINLDNSVNKTAAGVDVGTILATNVDNLTVNSIGANLDAAQTSSIASLNGNSDLETLTVIGNTALDVTTANDVTLTVAAAAFTAALRVDASTGTKNVNITGGTGNDVLGGSAQAAQTDVLNGGAGNDTLFGNTGADILTGGAGTDTFLFNTPASIRGGAFAVTDTNNANLDVITDFDGLGAAAGDVIRFGTTTAVAAAGITAGGFTLGGAAFTTATTSTVTAVTVATAANFTALATAIQAAIVGGGVASTNAAAQFYDVTVTAGSLAGRYVVLNDDTAAIATTDAFIGITGAVGALNANDFAFQS